MNNWQLSFDYAACFLLLLILGWYLVEKRIPLKTHKTFFAFVLICFASTGLEISGGQLVMLLGGQHDIFFCCFTALQFLCTNMVSVVFAFYIIQLSHVELSTYRNVRWIFRACVAIEILVIGVNPLTHWVFRFSSEGYVLSYGSLVLIAVLFVMITVSMIGLFKYGKQIPFSKRMVLLVHILCALFAAFIQFTQGKLILNFVFSCNCLTLYYYLQNPGTVTDAVTRQFNRRFFGEFIAHRFAERKGFGVIVLAMDDFKFINKTYGVKNGDNLLMQVGTYLDGASGVKNTVFRFGSDQFCVVIEKYRDQMDKLAQEIQERFKHPWYSENSVDIMMSASVCLVECPRDAMDYGELVEVIDYTMAVAKKLNKGMVSKASDMNLDKIQRDKAVEKAVKKALDRDELMVHYQPIFSVDKGVYNSAEALVRLKDSELGWISPEDFIPIAEKNGLIIEMGEVILEKVCRFIRDFNIANTCVEYIEVNISPVQLMQSNFADRVMAIMGEYGVKPEQINMEITETATMGSVDTVHDNIERLVAWGIKFSLDDYGSGRANIDYINRMPFSIIKLDKYIIWDAFKNNKAGITLEYTVGMLNALELHIVAEGVETADMRDRLVDIGCHYMQGWYYSKAVNDTEFIQLINEQTAYS